MVVRYGQGYHVHIVQWLLALLRMWDELWKESHEDQDVHGRDGWRDFLGESVGGKSQAGP